MSWRLLLFLYFIWENCNIEMLRNLFKVIIRCVVELRFGFRRFGFSICILIYRVILFVLGESERNK